MCSEGGPDASTTIDPSGEGSTDVNGDDAAHHHRRSALDRPRIRIEVHAVDAPARGKRRPREPLIVGGTGQRARGARQRRDGFGTALRATGSLVDLYPPDALRAATIADEVQVAAVGRPDGTPVHRVVVGDTHRRAAVRPHGPDVGTRSRGVATERPGISPIGDAPSARRNRGIPKVVARDPGDGRG